MLHWETAVKVNNLTVDFHVKVKKQLAMKLFEKDTKYSI